MFQLSKKVSSNRTFMELKSQYGTINRVRIGRSNRTFMELKLGKDNMLGFDFQF